MGLPHISLPSPLPSPARHVPSNQYTHGMSTNVCFPLYYMLEIQDVKGWWHRHPGDEAILSGLTLFQHGQDARATLQ